MIQCFQRTLYGLQYEKLQRTDCTSSKWHNATHSPGVPGVLVLHGYVAGWAFIFTKCSEHGENHKSLSIVRHILISLVCNRRLSPTTIFADKLTLKVYLNDSGIVHPLWNQTGSQGRVWHQVTLDYVASKQHQVCHPSPIRNRFTASDSHANVFIYLSISSAPPTDRVRGRSAFQYRRRYRNRRRLHQGGWTLHGHWPYHTRSDYTSHYSTSILHGLQFWTR